MNVGSENVYCEIQSMSEKERECHGDHAADSRTAHRAEDVDDVCDDRRRKAECKDSRVRKKIGAVAHYIVQ